MADSASACLLSFFCVGNISDIGHVAIRQLCYLIDTAETRCSHSCHQEAMHQSVGGVESMLRGIIVTYATYCGSQPNSFRNIPKGFIGTSLREMHIAKVGPG